MSRLPDQARALVVLAVETSRRLVGSASTYVAASLDAARSQDGPSAARVLSVAGPLVIPIVVTAVLGYTWRIWFRPSSVPKSSTTPAPLLPSRAFRAAHTRPVVFVGASGMGKTVLASTVLTALGPAAAQRVPAWTTRPRLPYETDGIDAYFVSRSTFAKLVSQGFFAEVFSAPSASAAAAVAAAAEADADVDMSSASSFTALASRNMDYYGVSQGDLTSCLSQGIIPLLVTPALPQSAALGDSLSVHVTCSSLSALLPALLSHARSVALATFSAALRDPPLRTGATEAGLVSAAAVAHHIRAVHADLAAAAAGAGLHLDTGYSRAWSKGTGAGTGDSSSSTSGNAAATTAAVLGEWVTAVSAACRAYGLAAAPSDVAYNAALAAAVTAFRDTLLAGITEPLGGLYESADSAAFSPSGAGAGAAAGPSAASAQSGHIMTGRASSGVKAGGGGCAPAAAADLVVTLSAASSADAVADVVSGAASGAGAGWGIGDTASRAGSELADAPVRPGSLAAATVEVCDFLALSMPWLHAHASSDAAVATAAAAAAGSDVAAKAAAEEAAEAAAAATAAPEVKARGGVRAIGSDTTSATAHLTLTAAAHAQSRPVTAAATSSAGASASADGAGFSPSSGSSSGTDKAAFVYSGTNERQNAPETVPVDSRRGTPSVSPAISSSFPGSQPSGETDGPAFPALAGGATGAQSVAVTPAPTPASAAPASVLAAAVSAPNRPAPSAAAAATAAPVAAIVAPPMTPAKGGVAAAESGSRRNVAARAAVFATPAPSATPAPYATPVRAPAFTPAATSALQTPLSGVAARAQAFAATAASASSTDAPATPAAADAAAAASAGAERRKSAFAANLDARLRAGPPKVAGASLPAEMGQATSHMRTGVPATPATPASTAAAAAAAATAAATAAPAATASSRGSDMVAQTPQRASNNGSSSLAPTPATTMSAAGTSATEGGTPVGVRGEGRIKIKRANKATKRYDFNANA